MQSASNTENLTRPGYMIGSPSIWADATVLPRANAARNGGGRKVFIGVGEKESDTVPMVKDAEALNSALGRPAAGFIVSQRVYAHQVHGSAPGPWMADGFRYLLTRPEQ